MPILISVYITSSICLSVVPSICPPDSLSVYPSVCLSASLLHVHFSVSLHISVSYSAQNKKKGWPDISPPKVAFDQTSAKRAISYNIIYKIYNIVICIYYNYMCIIYS